MSSPKANKANCLAFQEIISTSSDKGKWKDDELQQSRTEVQDDNEIREDGATLIERGKDSRLRELEQQLQIAMIRRDTLNQQVDYMKRLYQGVQRAPCHSKHKKDHPKRKSRSKDKLKSLNVELPPEKELPVKKPMDRSSKNSSGSTSSSPHLFEPAPKTEKFGEVEQTNNLITDLTKKENYSSHGGERQQSGVANELPIRHVNTEIKSTNEVQCSSTPKECYNVVAHERTSKQEGQLQSTTHVIQDILSGITNSVNQISQLHVHITDDAKESSSLTLAHGDASTQSSARQDQYQSTTNQENYESKELETANEKESSCANVKTPPETERQFNLNSCSDSNIEHMYDRNFNRIEADVSLTKRYRQRAGKRDIPPKLLENYVSKSIENVRENKRKGKSRGKQSEKKTKGLFPFSQINTNKIKPKVTDDVISVTTKIKRKRNGKPSHINSRSTISYKSDRRDLASKKHRKKYEEKKDPLCSNLETPYEVWQNDNLVEIYHNSSARTDMSASEENITRYSHASKSTLKGTGMQTYPLAEVYLQKHECQKTKRDTQKLKNYSKQEQNYMFDVPHGFVEGTSSPERKVQKTVHTVVHHEDQRHEKFDGRDAALEVVIPQIHFEDKYEEFPQAQSHPSNIKKNFQLPTVSSKMKQVNRNYFQRFNFRNIPFVAGTSTSPSYNLRLNFQQILSIIKMRHPVAGGVRHLFGGHQMGAPSMPQFCPRALSHKPFCATTMHGDILEIPEKDEETNFVRDTDLPSQHIRSRPASAAPFLNEFVEHNSDPWAIEQCDSKNKNNSSMRCTCFPPRRYVNYQDILNQYLQDGERPSFFKSAPPECQVPYRVQPLRTHYSTMSRGHDDRVMAKSVVSGHSTGDQHLTDNMKNAQRNNDDITLCKTKDKNPNFFVDIQGRTKSLKEVLINLHEDFSRLNSKYEELQTGVTQDTVDETEAMKELEAMETELQAKEDEITVVMALYKEVISLKEQVRALRKRASSANFTNQTTRIRPHHITVRPPTVGVRLTKLLRVIQQFQDELKHD